MTLSRAWVSENGDVLKAYSTVDPSGRCPWCHAAPCVCPMNERKDPSG